jgi:hypothetical protein
MNSQTEKLIYKILTDVLGLLLLVFFLDLIINSAVPELLAGFFSFTKLVILIFAVMLALVFLGRRNGIEYPAEFFKPGLKNKTAIFLAVIGVLLIVNSLFGLGLVEIIISTLLIVFILYYIFQILFVSD